MKNYREKSVVPLFQSYEEMLAEHEAALREYADVTEPLFAKYDARLAAIEGDDQSLAKFADPDIDLAKAYVKNHGASARAMAAYDCASVLVPALKRRNERLYGVGEMAKRSQRFAAAVSRRYQGPASDVVSIESKRT